MQTVNRKSLKFNLSAISKMVELRYFVESLNANPDIALRSGVFKGLEKDQVFSRKIHGWQVGFKLDDHVIYMKRQVYVKCEQPLVEVPDKDKDSMIGAVLEVFMDKGQSLPNIEQIAVDAILITQDFMPLLQVETNPHLRSISGVH